MLMNEKRCVITGLGLVCAIGNDTEECFRAALDGKSGIADATSFDTTECYSHKGAEVKLTDEELAGGKYDRTTALGIKAAGEAIRDAGIDLDSGDTNMTAFDPDSAFLDRLTKLAASEGLFVWKPPEG